MTRSTSEIQRVCLAVMLILLASCRKEEQTSAAAAPQAAPVAAAPAPVELKDVIETDPRFIVGISYPAAAAKYPGLAVELKRYADTARQDLIKAVADTDPNKQSTPFDLTLNFTLLSESPALVAVAADGSSFTGGAHSLPLVVRFVWLPQQNQMLRAENLLADPRGWIAISDFAREQLQASLSQRVDDDELPPAERASLMRSVGKMIDEGTEPKAESFRQFEPVLAPEGNKLMALRFVFPPYQAGSYVDGTRTVEVPAQLLMPYLAPNYRGLFTLNAPPSPAINAPPPSHAVPQLEAPRPSATTPNQSAPIKP